MKLLQVHILFIIIGLFSNCTYEKIDSPPETGFEFYLKETFQLEIIDERTVNLILPCGGCNGCNLSVIKKLSNGELKSVQRIIYCDPHAKARLENTNVALLFDSTGNFGNYTFGIGYPAIVETNLGKVVNFFLLPPASLDSICIGL